MPRPTPEQRREAIVATARRLFAEHGYHATNIAMVAGELGLGHGTFYRYFDNKLDIFGHVVDGVVADLAAALADEAPDAATSLSEYRAQVERIGRRLFDVFTADPHLARLIFVESVGIDEAITAKVRTALDLVAALTASYLQNGIARGFLRRDLDAEVTARVMNAAILEAVQQVLAADERERERDRWIAGVTTLVFEGIGA